MIIPKLSQPENSEPIGGYRFLDRVKVKVGSRLIMAVGQQAAMFFDGHEGLIIGQNKDLEYHVYFDKAKDFGYPDKVIDVFSTQNLVFLGSNVESTQTAYKPDVGDGLPLSPV